MPRRLVAGRVLLCFVMLCFIGADFVGPSLAEAQVPASITSSPPGATVYFNSTDQVIGQTPLDRVRLPRGQHTLIFALDGHEEARLNINVRRRGQSFHGTLRGITMLNIVAGGPSAEGALIRIDGNPAGSVPFRGEVPPGRHLVQVGRRGYQTFSQWVELASGDTLNLPVVLEAAPDAPGEILVIGDVAGASIFVDGEARGVTPTLVSGVSPGTHLVEVRPSSAEHSPWSETVTVAAGQRVTLSPQLTSGPTAQVGSVRLLSNVPNAMLYFDGENLGTGPATIADVRPGQHIAEARAPGYDSVQQTVTVEPGQEVVVAINLEEPEAEPGVIEVRSNTPGARVFIAGDDLGPPPIVAEVTPGAFGVRIEAPGFTAHGQTCEVADGGRCVVDVELEAALVEVRVDSNASNATLFLGDDEIGPIPYEGQLEAGHYRMTARADGYRDYVADVNLRGGDGPQLVTLNMLRAGELTPEEAADQSARREERHARALAHSARVLPDDLGVLDASLGWPFLAELRMGIGILDWLEAGVAIRTTFYRLTEIELRAKVGWSLVEQFSVGAQLRIGGGFGPSFGSADDEPPPGLAGDEFHKTNTFLFSLEGIASLHFARAGSFSLWMALDVARDRWSFNGENSDCRYTACEQARDGSWRRASGAEALANSQLSARLRLGGSLEFHVTERLNVWGSFDGILAGPERRILGDLWGFNRGDLHIFVRLGITYKFGYVTRDEGPEDESL